ncbi:MAG: phosphonoacetaldehyde hydrolase [Dehalococcoidia bacterium]
MTYRGPLRAVILDWAGTIVDFGSCAPVQAFVETFRRAGVKISTAEARGPMGSAKRDHIAALLAMPEVAARWQSANGAAPGDAEVDRLYADFIPIQLEVLTRSVDIIPGAPEAISALRERGLKIGSTTGYNRVMMDAVVPAATKQGLVVDHVATADTLPSGRPAPWMCFENMAALGVYPPAACVKIGDTVPDIDEGLNAGMWTIAVAATGNEFGLSEAEAAALPEAERRARIATATERLQAAGAHYVVDGIRDAPAVLDQIALRLANDDHRSSRRA